MKEGDAFVAVLARKGTLNIESETETERSIIRIIELLDETSAQKYGTE